MGIATYFNAAVGRIAEAYWRGTNTFRVILLNGSSAIGRTSDKSAVIALECPEINGYGRKAYAPAAGTYDTGTDQRYELPPTIVTFSAVGGAITWDCYAILENPSANANKVITLVDPATDTLTAAGHGLVAGEEVMVTVDSGGTLPGGVSGTTIYYAAAIAADTLKLSTTADGLNIVDITSAGSGTLRLRYAKGNLVLFRKADSAQTIADGASASPQLAINVMNSGSGTGV